MVIKSVQVQAFEVRASKCEKSKKTDLYLGSQECRPLFDIVLCQGSKLMWTEMTKSPLIILDDGHLYRLLGLNHCREQPSALA